ncbi:hypothetical protein H634G_05537 [Metarhizium anisopliae BRIP 53293]|uniref:Uncharacterized protein n=1 Tax=Metarhizium anisopliae BRIP 53293 TaxID=1291518 RepID=A0A0D9NZ12_METAN|nr:hypothetical protein H634G_05537 [Metarhizium anisopliae BRIP 53293]KJK85025.1 hypothetical protein H633G_11144 [Metarhizium anisopliae BRIP 53284]
MEDEAARDIFARTWGFHITAVNPEPYRSVPQGEGNPLSVDPLSVDPLGVEMTFLRLSQIVNRCQRHRCNTTYCLRVRKGSGDLARDMEGAAADIEAANVEGKSYYIFEAARNDNLMNHFNPAIILGWLANIDISLCTSLQAVITEHYNTYSDDYYGEPDTNELRAEDNEFKPKIHEKPVTDKD